MIFLSNESNGRISAISCLEGMTVAYIDNTFSLHIGGSQRLLSSHLHDQLGHYLLNNPSCRVRSTFAAA